MGVLRRRLNRQNELLTQCGQRFGLMGVVLVDGFVNGQGGMPGDFNVDDGEDAVRSLEGDGAVVAR